ncbi:penicillin-binding transpeptidase domain-containing protein [Corynebacterium timonense]|uniref:Cell division protein FtsI/penicillin-binding protein 2 n=1 Tax=Corynebacterium timonense TaxID=441500 RepID=A0A1H1N1I3_9CORY|nr:penicillin-binding transpeptidase domain-containing protein [Corynebacterium timonense]SDR92777.1 Cell division protein FtsI/penicillin-binding protein 2 [Corynebacterium timonense]
MKKSVASVGLVSALVVSLCACTPKPRDAEPAAADFLTALTTQDYESLASLVDAPAPATDIIRRTWDGLQAEGASAEIAEVRHHDNVATVRYRLDWDLPRGRDYAYDATMTLTKTGEEWTVRWQPSIVNPRLGASQHLELRAKPADKASVVSSDGVELMAPGVAYRVLVDPAQVRDAQGTARRVVAALDRAREVDQSVPRRDAEDLEGQIRGASGSYSVAVVPAAAVDAFRAELGEVPGVRLNEEAAMVTADPGFAPDIMARVGELVRDDLEGEPGWSISVVNENGAALEELEGEAPKPSPAIRVSLDHAVQRAAERALEPLAGQQAMIVAIRPSTGGVLAVAQTPAADKDGNVATMGQYPPGSTFKIITAAAGLQLQGVGPETIVPCPGTMDIYGRVVTNYGGFSLGSVPLERAFAASCNTTFADMSTRLEPGQLKDVGKQFGLGIDLSIPGLETITGSIPGGEEALDRTEAGYGQGHDLASPFGMALVAATAAHGSMPVPYLLPGQETEVSESVSAPGPEVIEQLQRMMAAVTAPGGTAPGMSAGGDIRGKTGEAEIDGGSHSWFTGYRVDDDIAFATLIVLGGGSDAAVGVTDRMLLNLDQARNPG